MTLFVGRHHHGDDPAAGAHDHIHGKDGQLAPGGAGLFVAEHAHADYHEAKHHTPEPGNESPGAAGQDSPGALLMRDGGRLEGPPTRLDLEAARERIRQASEGPWGPSKATDAVIAPNAKRWSDIDVGYYGGPMVGESMLPADREFIIHARTDLSAALDELEAARDLIEFVRQAIRPWVGKDYGMGPPLDAKLAAYDQVTKEKRDGD